MTYASIDALQLVLAETVFSYASDQKKAAGRALGTLVEVVTFYALQTWGLTDNLVIERRISEFANPVIRHNVEFSLHPVISRYELDISDITLPITGTKIRNKLSFLGEVKQVQVLSNDGIRRNSALLLERDTELVVANINTELKCIVVCKLATQPFAIIECKRVGVEEGMSTGPQTIEKAKQRAYVARSVSSLQKIRLRSGQFYGVIENEDGSLYTGPYKEVLRQLIEEDQLSDINDFILTVGVVSNHGNWFTSDNPNKELLVLSQSYDYLLFLTDEGLANFIENLLLNPLPALAPIGEAFRASYTGQRGKNRFTKVRVDVVADELLRRWFQDNQEKVEGWFNLISPSGMSLDLLRADLVKLARKEVQA
ncbi:hypothetical protein [Candidatus Poriferisocius sp.]|uniref:hypothetical protein n=1 Tax=Candidatus Poriferisocius sp. TaxID=3101276 RepID=UPI003B02CB8F